MSVSARTARNIDTQTHTGTDITKYNTCCQHKRNSSWTRNAFCETWYMPHSHVQNERTVPIITVWPDVLRMHEMAIFPLLV